MKWKNLSELCKTSQLINGCAVTESRWFLSLLVHGLPEIYRMSQRHVLLAFANRDALL